MASHNTTQQRAHPVKNTLIASKCLHCQAPFTILKRKHPCGQCSKLFCSACITRQVQIPKFGHKTPIQVCSSCFGIMCLQLNDRNSLEQMTLVELKRIAVVSNVDLNGCVEKEDIINKLWNMDTPLPSATSYSMKKEELPSLSADEAGGRDESKNKIAKIEDLSVATLKLILHNNGVDYSDCLEKGELVHKIEKHCPHVIGVTTKSELFNIPEQEQCIICYDSRIDCVLLECGHLAVCVTCSKNLRECPICRRLISRVVQTFHVNK